MHALEKLKSHREMLLALWYEALKSPVGIFIKVNKEHRKLLMQQLYKERNAKGTADLEDISLCWPKVEGDDELWLVQKKILDPSWRSIYETTAEEIK